MRQMAVVTESEEAHQHQGTTHLQDSSSSSSSSGIPRLLVALFSRRPLLIRKLCRTNLQAMATRQRRRSSRWHSVYEVNELGMMMAAVALVRVCLQRPLFKKAFRVAFCLLQPLFWHRSAEYYIKKERIQRVCYCCYSEEILSSSSVSSSSSMSRRALNSSIRKVEVHILDASHKNVIRVEAAAAAEAKDEAC